MARMLLVVILTLINFVTTQVHGQLNPSTSSTTGGCKGIITKAESRTKYVTSPNFPKSFPGDASCSWAIYCEPGKRIRLEFQRFFLLEPVDGTCFYQYIKVKSPFTLFSMGPYCGQSGLPTIVSTGNLIYVELETPVPVTTDNYEGFKLAFKVTEESSSYELRPDNSVDDIIMTIDPATMDILSPTPPTTTITTKRVTKSTTKSSRFIPSRQPPLNTMRSYRPNVNQANPNQNYPPRTVANRNRNPGNRIEPPRSNNYGPGSNNVERILPPRPRVVLPEESKKSTITTEVIVGIAVGGLVAVALLLLILLKVRQSCSKKKSKKHQGDAAVNRDASPVHNGNSLPLYYPTMGDNPEYLDGYYPDKIYYYDQDGNAYEMKEIPTHVTGHKSSTLPASYKSEKYEKDRRGYYTDDCGGRKSRKSRDAIKPRSTSHARRKKRRSNMHASRYR